VVAATNRNLRQMVEDRTFRQDLYYRLSVLPIIVPPLREHREDLPLLINHILAKLHKATGHKIAGVSPEFLEILQHYEFPGNIRELENIIEHSVLLTTGAVLTPETLPPEVMDKVSSAQLSEKIAGEGMTLKQARDLVMEQVEGRMIKQTLDECRDNFSLAARKLGISRSALYYKIKKYKME
jgi:transcriptional regulator with PAS, ATPase and Fis domain